MKKITLLKSLFVAFLLSCTALLSAADYVKVTTAPTDWSGTYLIVSEDGNVALTDAVDAVENGTAVTIADGKITTDANIAFTIAAVDGGYSIKGPNGQYIGSTADKNELKIGTTAYVNTISIEDGGAKIAGTSSILRYNASSDQKRFRYYKASTYTGQKPVQLYKLVETPATPAITATWNIQEGATLESFTDATITFAGVEAVKAKNTYGCTWIYEKAADGSWQLVSNMCTAGYMDATASGASLTLGVDPGCYSDDFTSPFSRKGEYRIVIPVGGVYFNGDKANLNTEEYVLNFVIENNTVVVPEVDAVFTATPAANSSVAEIREIVLQFTEYTTITVAEPDMMKGSNIPQVYFEDELTGSLMPAGYIMFKADSLSANGLRLYVDPTYTGGAASYATEGKYTIRIPAGVVTFGEAGTSKEIILNYTVKAPVITEMEAKNAYAYDVVVAANEELTKATVSYRLNAPAVAVKVQATVNGEVVREVAGTTVCRYVDGVADNMNTVEVSLEGLGGNVVFQVAVEGTLVEAPALVPVNYGFYHSQGVDVDVNPESKFFGRIYATECTPDGIGKDYHSTTKGQALYVFNPTFAPIANNEGTYGFTGGLTTDAANKDPRKVRVAEDGRVFLTRQAITGVSPLVEVNPADLNANFTDVFVGFTHDAETYELKTADGKFMASPNIAFDVKGEGENLKVFMLSTTKKGIAYNPRGNFAKEYNLGTATTWSAEPSATIDALDTLTHYTVNYLGASVEYDNEGGIWYSQYRGTPKESEPTLVHVNAQGVEDYKDYTFVSRSSAIRFNKDYSLLAIAGNGAKKCTIFKVEKDADGKPVLKQQYEFAVNGNNVNDMAWDYANNLYIVNSSSELLYMFAMPRESAVVTTPAAARYAVEMPLPMQVEFENIAAIYKMGMWDMEYYESYSQNEVKAILKSQPTVVEVYKMSGMMGGTINNYYLNDGTGVIVLQAEGDMVNPITDENWEVIGWDTIPGLNLEVGKKLPADFTATIDFKTVTDDETYMPNGEIYGAPTMVYIPRETGEIIVDEYGWETKVTETNEAFVARCTDSDFVEDTVTVTVDDLLANRINYAGKLVAVNAESNYYAEQRIDYISGTTSTNAYMYWDAETAFDVESYEEEGTTYVLVSPKMTEDWNNYAGKVFNVLGENLLEAAFDAKVYIDVDLARFDWNSIAVGQSFLVKKYKFKGHDIGVDVENNELVVNIYSNNGNVYVETEAGAMIEVYTVNGLRVYAGVSNTNTTIINGLNTNIAIIRVNGETYKVFVK